MCVCVCVYVCLRPILSDRVGEKEIMQNTRMVYNTTVIRAFTLVYSICDLSLCAKVNTKRQGAYYKE